MKELEGATYLGDGVYLVPDTLWPAQIWLKVSNGIEITQEIALDPYVQAALTDYIKMRKQK